MKKIIETYEIWKDGRFFAKFHKGDPSRFNQPIDQEIMLKEFASCVDFWTKKDIGSNWELRICLEITKQR
jgi:hypothetical protein